MYCRSGPGSAFVGTEQSIDETTKPIGLADHGLGYRDAACAEQPERFLNLLVLAIRTFEVLSPIAHGTATSLREPERRIISRAIKLIPKVSETTLL